MMKLLILLLCIFTFGANAQIVCGEVQSFEEKFHIPLKLNESKVDARFDETKQLKESIEAFMKTHPDWKISEIEILSSSSHTPVAKPSSVKNTKEVRRIDKENKRTNQQLAEVRRGFVEKMLSEVRLSHSHLSSAKMIASSSLLGPLFQFHSDPRFHDQNLKFVVPEFTENYESRVSDLFESHKADYLKVGILDKSQLLDKEIYKSLYEVKFKAFQGYFVMIKGKKKLSSACAISPDDSKGQTTSKQ